MSDPRLTPSNGRVAHTSLRGRVDAEVFTDGHLAFAGAPVVDLLDAPMGARQCQLLFGEPFRVLDEEEDAFHAFGYREADGYVGWVSKSGLHGRGRQRSDVAEYRVCVPRAPMFDAPEIKTAPGGDLWAGRLLSLGSRVWHRPLSQEARERDLRDAGWFVAREPTLKVDRWVYLRWSHVVPVDHVESDPAGVAERFLHTPYLWGGDSGHGMDCSGLVQRSLAACGIACPRDSDQQAAAFEVASDPYRRGDLVFWERHVGILLDAETLLHANAHHMAVATEPLAEAVARIGAREFGAVTKVARPGSPVSPRRG
ncbi:MAG: NlpC/P60 family protein [Pseudomonadota bacterium]